MRIRPAQTSDLDQLAHLCQALWPSSSAAVHAQELRLILEGNAALVLTMPIEIFVADASNGTLVGFVEVDLRSHADGCNPSQPVGYIEGWYVTEDYRHHGIADDELSARIVLIEALLSQGKQGEAQKEVEAAQPLENKSQNRFLRLQFELASGRVFLASDHPDASRPIFQRVAGDAQRYRFIGLQFAEELALAEFAYKTQHRAQAQMELHALQKAATSKGFGLIAHKAVQRSSLLWKQTGPT